MTTVHIALADTNPLADHVTFQRWTGAALFGEVIRAYLVGGEATVVLETTVSRAWRWRAQEHGHNDVVTRHVAVPASGTVEYDNLIDVDPTTMQPDDEPEAAWWQALEDVALGTVPDGSIGLSKLAPEVLAELAEGSSGASAYEVAVANGFSGTETQWLASLVGPAGEDGEDGVDGDAGLSAYQLAVQQGYPDTLSAWLASLAGPAGADGDDGSPGLNAYQVAVSGGFVGSQAQWLTSLVGPAGDDGDDGEDGADGDPGAPGVFVKVWNGTAYVDASGTAVYVGGTTDPTVNNGDIWIELA